MNEIGLRPNAPVRASAPRIVGDVMGKYHPHGDSAIYDTLVRMAQDFSMRYPLVDGQGNFGSIDGDPRGGHALHRGAPRARSRRRCCATSTRTRSTSCPTTTAASQEPLVLPARFPNLLVNGSSGIAVGMATNIPPHNLREVDRRDRSPTSTTRTIDARRPDAAHQGPRLPDRRHHPRPRRASATPTRPAAAACACARARTSSRSASGKEAIIVTELPYMVKKGGDGGADPEDRRPRPRQEDPRDLRPARRVRPQRHARS